MLVQIKHRFTGSVIFECECSLKTEPLRIGFAVKAAISAGKSLAGASLADANLAGAYLAGAYLAGANLAGAYLAHANLADANLAVAYLAHANLAGANLAGANLAGANLAGANLAGAYLAHANLAGASLAGAYLAVAYLAGANLAGAKNIPESTPVIGTVTLAEFRSEIVPQLLTAGGKTVAEIVNGGSWECHDWSNCPMHAALGIDDASKAPIIIRPLVEKFVELYDAGLIPCPVVETEGGA